MMHNTTKESVVITGSTKGFGFGLAKSLLDLGCRVTISGRSEETVTEAEEKLLKEFDRDQLHSAPCDVRKPENLQELWKTARERFGAIDIWINNAGLSNLMMKTWESDQEEIRAVVETNLLGVIFGSQVAILGMLEQGYGRLYNVEGMGSDGRMHDGLVFYGMTKYGVRYFTKGLVEETRGTPLIVGSLSPGMLITDLVTDQYRDRPEEWEQAKRIFNIIADKVETVAPWMAQKILSNQKSGARISWITRGKILTRFLLAPLNRRNLFD